MLLILMRHAEAGESDLRRWPDDRLRPLTEEGCQIHGRVARVLRRMGVRFDHLLTSPLVRARRTAEITAEAYGRIAAIEVADELGAGVGVTDLLPRLRRYPRDAAVLCVGHEPHLSHLAATLISRDGRAHIELAKSGVIAIEAEGHPAPAGGALAFHLAPRHLAALADDA
jgi:phosphohistidine phosphatase